MVQVSLINLEGNFYSCKQCLTHFALEENIINKNFTCTHGEAYLVDKVVNVTTGEKESRNMLTGKHIVVDISCAGCRSIVGWKYETAQDMSQKYKEGKFILERYKLLGPGGSICLPPVNAIVPPLSVETHSYAAGHF
ncbi:protein yippee-like At3g08990 [Lotus japonicus]|uniref:protein yippee-like At3g08990 n=1 Tax=Lotus japonicus TaxID=34305 RepID=UPI00258C95E0|nr:protein yippee-like At3g08990 [Lotus japonicus]